VAQTLWEMCRSRDVVGARVKSRKEEGMWKKVNTDKNLIVRRPLTGKKTRRRIEIRELPKLEEHYHCDSEGPLGKGENRPPKGEKASQKRPKANDT